MKLLFIFLPLLFTSTLVAQPAPNIATSFDHTYSSFNALLSQSVKMKNKGQKSIVNYKNISQADINSVVESMLKLSKKEVMTKFTYDQRLSYFINLYNALTIKIIKGNYKKVKSKGNTIKAIGSLFKSTWKKKFFVLFGKKTSLDEVEHGYIRGHLGGFSKSAKEYKDPRIHFAVNCASKGCPSLLNEAFTATNLRKNMQKAMVNFLKDRSRNSYKSGYVYLSPIFKWYKKDFSRGLSGYTSLEDFVKKNINHITDNPQEAKSVKNNDFTIKYTEYDWTLNDAI